MDYNGKSYADLPMEILLRILDYLNASDILEASLTCRQWFNALCHKKYVSHIQIQFDKLQLNNLRSPPLNIFTNSMRDYSKVRLNQVDLDENSLRFWQRFGEHITHVELNACDLNERTFSAILMAMVNLESLTIVNCRDLFLTGHLLKSNSEAVRVACKNVKSLSLSNNRYLSDSIFSRIMGAVQNIQSLNLSGCFVSFHSALYRKFYPKSQQEPSENVFTFFVIVQFIESNAKTLKFLDFSETLIDSNALNRLAEVEHLQLLGLKLRSCDQLTNNGISKIVNRHKSIVEIDLSLSVRFTDLSLLDICHTLSYLRVLKMRRCRAITDQSIKELHQLKHLESLDLSECDGITSKGFIEGIASRTNDKMVELYLSALNISELAVIKLAESLKNLRVLDLSFCKNAVTNLAVQIMFKHLKQLRTLNLEFCDMVSDMGITGLGMKSTIEQYERSILLRASDAEKPVQGDINNMGANLQMNVRCIQPPNRNPHHISLRSKAEEDIVNESKRKALSVQLCAQLTSNAREFESSGYSIANLKGLRSLNLASCDHITDVSLKRAFDFLELETLSLSKCQQITEVGIEGVTLKCPSIKVLRLSDCHSLCDHAIDVISSRLKRLTYLHIDRCIQLTDISLDSISKYCKHLKYIDVRGCRLMCSEPGLKLQRVRSLQQILVSKPGPYIDKNGSQPI